MRGKRLGLCVAACAVASACAAGSAQAANIFQYELYPESGLQGVQYQAEAGENNALRITAKVNPSTYLPGEFEPKVVTFEDRGAPLTTHGFSSNQHACDQLSPHKVRCVAPDDAWVRRVNVLLTDGVDRVRAVGAGLPGLDIDPQSSGPNHYTLSNGWVRGVGTGETLRFRPPGGGGAWIAGRPKIWLADGAAEYIECRAPANPRIVMDPLDEFNRTYC